MKLVFNRPATSRRAATGTVLALAAATLSLGVAGPASAANDVELQGHVSGVNGVPLPNIYVEVDDAVTGGFLAWVYTDASGNYSFDNLPAGSVKVDFRPDSTTYVTTTLTSPLPYQERWSGGSRYEKGASSTTITVDPTTPASVNANLPQYASVIGNIRVGADGHIPDGGFDAYALNTDDRAIASAAFTDDATGDYRIIVDPSTPVRVQAGAADVSTAYLDQYWRDADTLAGAIAIPIAPGQNVSGINFRLTNSLRNRQAPAIHGHPTIGRALTASPGTWTRNAATEFSYSWLRNGVVVGTGATYVPTAKDYHRKLTVVVTALNGQFTGQSSTVTSRVVKWGAKERVTRKARAGRTVAVHVRLVSAHQKPVRGRVVVLRNGRVVKSHLKLVHGKVAFILRHQPKGRQTYTVHFKGNKRIAKVDKAFTVRVHK
jgi:hypothetical protein